MPIKNFFIHLQSIARFLDRAFLVDDEHNRVLSKTYTEEEWGEYGEAEYDRAYSVLIFYQEIVVRAVLGELNALVEYELKFTANQILNNREGINSDYPRKKVGREKAVEIIEEEYSIQLNQVSRFSEVDEIRNIVNAYKHDKGYGKEHEQHFWGQSQKKYDLDPNKAREYLSAVRAFLRDLPGERADLGGNYSRAKFSDSFKKWLEQHAKRED